MTIGHELLLLPNVYESELDFVRSMWPYFDPERFRENLEIAKQAVSHLIHGPDSFYRQKSKGLLQILSLIEKYYSSQVDCFAQARPVKETLLSSLLDLQEIAPGQAKTVDDLTETLESRFRETTRLTLCFSDSHLSAHPETMAAVSANPQAKIGLLVFDRHADFYYRKAEGNIENIDRGKRNFLIPLLKEDLIAAAAVVGLPKYDLNEIMSGKSVYEEFSNMHTIMKHCFPGRISLADEGRYLRKSPEGQWVDYQKLDREIKEQVRFLYRAGARQLVFSFDLDVLRPSIFGYTAFEYTPTGWVLGLGVQDFSLSRLRRLASEEKRTQQLAEEEDCLVLDSLHIVSFPVNEAKRWEDTRPGKACLGYGLPLLALNQGIKIAKFYAREQGLGIGVLLPKGGRYLGGFYELSAPDVGGRAARAAKTLTSCLFQD